MTSNGASVSNQTRDCTSVTLISVDPFRCAMWEFHDRLDPITAENCRAEINSFQSGGQLVPVLGRTLHGDPQHDVELIYGARRLFVTRYLKIPLIVELRDLSDREAIIAMDVENRQRLDISPYERGRSYAKWIQTRHFASQEDLAKALHISASQVSRYLKLARLPAVVVGAFPHSSELRETWGVELIDALDEPERRTRIMDRARAIIASNRHEPARQIFKQLMMSASSPNPPQRPSPRDEVITDTNGRPLFRIKHQTRSVAFLLPTTLLTAKANASIRDAIRTALQEERSLHDDFRLSSVSTPSTERPQKANGQDVRTKSPLLSPAA